jgi:processive 1,2-diacylglycerol beta-glucosyltransferase/1,2-diacylglycerol 3-beta-galactosyltransferase
LTAPDKKYLLLFLHTGGGHLAPAKSIAGCLEKLSNGSVVPVLVDGFEKAINIVRFLIEDGYRGLQREGKWFYEFLYALYFLPTVPWINDIILKHSIVPYLEKKILSDKPEKIIIFHFFLIRPVYNIIKKHKLNIKVFTVVTDPFTAHPFWFVDKKQTFILFSERLKKHALKLNIAEKNLNVFPFILDEKYSSAIPAEQLPGLKKNYGFDPDKKTVLIFGGGDGIPKGEKILEIILKSGIDINIGIVSGKNDSLVVKSNDLKSKYKRLNLQVFGYVDFVYELLNISDFIITKAGASAMMEILHLKKIPIVIDYIWGQEKGNMEFIRDNNMGIYEKDINKLPSILNDLITSKEKHNFYIDNITKENLIIGTEQVSRFILNS